MEMIFSSGNFLPGVHEVAVKAIDIAGNERTTKVQFVVDLCLQEYRMEQQFVNTRTL